MINCGKIVDITDTTVKIKVIRESACGGNCASCAGCELKDHFIFADKNLDFDFSPSVGDNVNIYLDNKTFYLYTISGYLIFVIFIILGAVLSYIKYKTETASILGAGLGLLISFLIVKFSFKNKKSAYKITKSES